MTLHNTPTRSFEEFERLGALYRERVEGFSQDPQVAEQWYSLVERLLDIGGDLVVPEFTHERFAARLLTQGVEFTGARQHIKGEVSQCHYNAALWWARHDSYAIGTGFALSDDGLWRRHSWGVRGTTVLESTVDREAYFGIELRGAGAWSFALEEADSALERLLDSSRHAPASA